MPNKHRTPANKRIVFIDIDGPFVKMRSALSQLPSDPISVGALNNFLKIPNTQAVISSTERKLRNSAEAMGQRLKGKYGIDIPRFHTHWRTGDSCELRQDEVLNWLNEHGRDPDTDYIAIDDDPINIEGVFHVKADYNGIATEDLMLLTYLAGNISERELKGWREFSRKKMLEAAALLKSS